MNLTILALHVCLNASAPQPCKEVDLILDLHIARDCFLAGQTKAIDWLDTHPGYRLDGFECHAPGDQKA